MPISGRDVTDAAVLVVMLSNALKIVNQGGSVYLSDLKPHLPKADGVMAKDKRAVSFRGFG